jgi:hypothetical protein
MTRPVISSDLSAVALGAKAEAKQSSFAVTTKSWIASSISLLAMTVELVCGLRKEA